MSAGALLVMNVLICEDDATTRLLLKSMLKKAMPCEVVEVPNGVEAQALLRKKTFDLLLLDLMMPIMGGQDTLRWIRQTPSLQDLQVIVLSGENDAHQVKEMVTLGVVDFLLKPVSDPRTQVRLLSALAKLKLHPRRTLATPGVTAPSPQSGAPVSSPDFGSAAE
jgi:CheY-like chemotaxis protein